tara:strand:+ start:611 stop:847 length:237 start_codon:yes stop_codon:yes gene_type:complete
MYGSMKMKKTTKKGNARKGAMPGSRLAFDDTKQEKKKMKKEKAKAKSGSSWIAHVKKVRKKGESYKDALKRASKTYKK